MSAWCLFNAMGFYPVCPGANFYAFGSPVISKVRLSMENGKSFTVVAKNLSEKNIYIQKVTLNGKTWDKPYFHYDELKNGVEMELVMGPESNKRWGLKVDFSEQNNR